MIPTPSYLFLNNYKRTSMKHLPTIPSFKLDILFLTAVLKLYSLDSFDKWYDLVFPK